MIQAIGRYLQQDADGWLLSDSHWDKVPEHWREVLAIVVEAYRRQLGEQIHSIYLRGSVAAGLGIDGHSDLDTFALVYDEKAHWEPLAWGKGLETDLRKKFSFVREVEVVRSGISAAALVNPFLAAMLKLQSICLWGENLIPHLPKVKPSFALARNYRWLTEDVTALRGADQLSDEEIKSLLKAILRSGFELVLEREGKYTTDLYPCYQSFSKYYPDWEPEMKQVLLYYLQVPSEKACLEAIADGLGQQLIRWFKD